MTIDPKTSQEIEAMSKRFCKLLDFLRDNPDLSPQAKLTKIFSKIGKIDYCLYETMLEFIGYVPQDVEERYIDLGLITF